MATTQLADIIEPRVFMRYQMKETEVKSALFTSGILRSDEQLSTFLSGGGKTVDVPFWNDLGDGTDPNIGNDNPASVAGTAKIGSGDDVAIRHNRNKGWSSARLAGLIAGDDPQARIAQMTGSWWRRSFNQHLISTLKGVFADNAANDGGNMRVVIGNDLASAVTDAERVSAEAVIDAAQTMGDSQEDLALLMMHSVIYTRLKKQNLIDFIPDSEGRVRFATYLGYRIVVDDNCPAVAGSNRILYSTYLVGMGAIAFAEVPPPMPVEVDREPSQGNGQGVDYLWTRRQYIMHPYGIKWTSSSMAGTSPTNAELATTANWDRVYTERKMIKLAELVTNG
jgi:hypothetical protein